MQETTFGPTFGDAFLGHLAVFALGRTSSTILLCVVQRAWDAIACDRNSCFAVAQDYKKQTMDQHQSGAGNPNFS
jgi:hypothetical protein